MNENLSKSMKTHKNLRKSIQIHMKIDEIHKNLWDIFDLRRADGL